MLKLFGHYLHNLTAQTSALAGMRQCDGWGLGSPSLDVLLIYSTVVRPSGGLAFWEAPVFMEWASPSGVWSSGHFCATIQVWLWCSKVALKSGSLIKMAAHLVTHPSPICISPVGSTTMLPNTFMASIPNSRSNLDICLCFPPDRTWHKINKPKINYSRSNLSMLILAEPLSSMDMVTTPTLQHRRDMPSIVMTSTIALFQDWHWSASTIKVSIVAEYCILST